MVQIKVIKGDQNLMGQTLSLKETSEMIYQCEETGFPLVDTWNEIEAMIKEYKKSKARQFYELHLFIQSNTGLQFIDEIEFISHE